VWGGVGISEILNSGGRYNPSTNSWRRTSDLNAPSERYAHTTVWTGTHMIIWGGGVDTGDFAPIYNKGGRYDPVNNQWIPTTLSGAPVERAHHSAVWTGKEVIIWGGENANGVLKTGRIYTPFTDSWCTTKP
jgi:N-acetylneuraminic acid mutarotase